MTRKRAEKNKRKEHADYIKINILYVFLRDEVVVEKLEDIVAEVGEFALNLLLVILEEVDVLGSLGLLLLLNG